MYNYVRTNVRNSQKETGVNPRQCFLKYDIKSITTKENTETLNFIRIQNFCASKDTINREGNPQRGRKYMQTTSNKELISRIYKELLQLSNNKTHLKNGQRT